MSKHVLIILAAGINTNLADDFFKDLKEELKKRYEKSGKAVRFKEVFPIGEEKDSSILKQIVEVGLNMHHGTGGSKIVSEIMKEDYITPQIILIGHSGGGQAVGDAASMLERKGVNIHHSIQVGSPEEMLDKKIVHKVTRVQVKTDFVSHNVLMGTETLFQSLNPVSGFISWIKDLFTKKMPETIYVDINIESQPYGGHSAYFIRGLRNKSGIDNVTSTVDAIWERIK